MLPSLGFQEILLLGILALVVVGPKDLPLLFRKLGRWTAKLRGMAQEFRTGFDELARQAELDELKREVEALRRTTSITEITREMQKPLPTLEEYAGVAKPLPAPSERGSSEPQAIATTETSASEDARSEYRDLTEPTRSEAAASAETGASEDARSEEAHSGVQAGAEMSASEDARSEARPIARSAP
jgi:sec-independent protein translocase protein TatB